MSFFLFSKQIVDMLYQYQFLDYIMVSMVFILLLYQIALVRPEFKKWYTITDLIVLALIIMFTVSFLKNMSTYQTYFKIISAFFMYFVGRIYYDRIQECYGALVSASYIIIYLNFFERIWKYGTEIFLVRNAEGDFYYYDTDMAFAMILSMIFICMFGKNSVWKLFTIFIVCPYMVFYSDAGIQKVLMIVVYGIILLYVLELIFRKKSLFNVLLAMMIIGILAVVVIIYIPIFEVQNRNLVLGLFDQKLLTIDNMHIRYESWQIVMEEWKNHNLMSQVWGINLNTGIPVESLYIRILYSIGVGGLLWSICFIVSITCYVARVEDRKTFYLTIILNVMLLGTGVTVNSIENVQMSWFPLLFTGMVVSSVDSVG